MIVLAEVANKPNFFLVLNASDPSHPSTTRNLSLQLESLLPPSSRPLIFKISTQLSIDALEALNPLESNKSPSIEKFQSYYSKSGIIQLKDTLAESVKSLLTPSSSNSGVSALQLQTATFVLTKAIRVATFAGAKIEDELITASNDVAALQFQTEEASKAVLKELGVVDGRLLITSYELKSAKLAVDEVFNTRLQWYKLPFCSDDIPTELSPLLQSTYLNSFESKLIFDTGRLISLAQMMSNHTDNLLSTSAFTPSSSLHSPLSSIYSSILINHVSKAAFESTQISSSSLSSPLTNRRNQLTSPGGPVEILQIKSQSAVLSSVTLGTSSIVVGVVMDLMEYAELGMSLGVAALGCMIAARRLQNQWHKAKIRFGRDLEERVTRGLEDDLGVSYLFFLSKTCSSLILMSILPGDNRKQLIG